MREYKWAYMHQLFQRIEDAEQSQECWKECTSSVYELDSSIRRCYAKRMSHKEKGHKELAEIVLLDGCFILELFLKYEEHLNMTLDYQSDAIFNSAWMIAALQHDLALLENQIPFFSLERLYKIIKPHLQNRRPDSVASLALNFFQPMNYKAFLEDWGTDYNHLLDVLHKFYLPSNCDISAEIEMITELKHHSKPGSVFGSSRKWGFKFCALELLEAGIEFQKQQRTDHLLNITFSRGVIKMPPIFIDDSLLRNLIAFEQCSLGSLHHMTSYAILLKSLIRYPKDIKVLKQRGVIGANWIREEEYLSQLKSILDEVVVKEFYFGDLCDKVNAYHGKFWFRRGIKYIYRTYFSTAWSMISFVAAIILFILTATQTFFTVRPRQ
ncbi:UPF0481 protein At3g47200-like isoform X2 [Argentina anserina]|nr:UPF0481 protein At3g47200-like isoform X2 [Potentilla anserina]